MMVPTEAGTGLKLVPTRYKEMFTLDNQLENTMLLSYQVTVSDTE